MLKHDTSFTFEEVLIVLEDVICLADQIAPNRPGK